MPDHAVTTQAVTIAGITISFREIGDPYGTPVVLLHGGSSSADTWDALAADLASAAQHRAIAPDLRGHAHSSRTEDYPLAGFRDDIIGLLDALALPRVALVGHSLGGYVASLIAQQQPERVTRLVLEEPPVPPRHPAAPSELSPADLVGLALTGLDPRRQYHRRAITSVLRQLRVPDPAWWDRLASITAPTLLISGGPSSHISSQGLADVAGEIPQARLITIPAGHRIHSRRPREFRDAVIPFLTDTDDGGS